MPLKDGGDHYLSGAHALFAPANHGWRHWQHYRTYNPKTIQIYTDWANHYLERGRSKRYIQDLQNDVSDGVLLADVIEAVTGAKVPDINRKPKGTTQMLENINSCLLFLGNLGVNTEDATAKDIKDGNLKTVLGLFFSLSRFKQAQKAAAAAAQVQQQQQQQQLHQVASAQNKGAPQGPSTDVGEMMLSKLPSPFKSPSSQIQRSALPLSNAMGKGHSTSSLSLSNSGIPTPSSGGGGGGSIQRRSFVNDRSQTRNSFTPSSGIMGGLGSVVTNSGSIGQKCSSRSRSGSPLHANQSGNPVLSSSVATSNPTQQPSVGGSFIPQPRGIAVVARDRNNADRSQSRPSSTSSTSSVSHLPIKASGVNGVTYRHGGASRPSAGAAISGSAYHHGQPPNNNNNNNNQLNGLNNNNNSMLDKFKLFNPKDKASEKSKSGAVSKRTSSSSGFSSARSERSDSSTSLCSEPKTTPDGPSSSSEPPSVSSSVTTTPSSVALTPNSLVDDHHGPVPVSKSAHGQSSDAQPLNTKPAVKSIAKKPFSRTKPLGSKGTSKEEISPNIRSGQKASSSLNEDGKRTVKGPEERRREPRQPSSTLTKQDHSVRVSKVSNLKKVKSTSTLLLDRNADQSSNKTKADKMENKPSETEMSSPNGGPNSGIPKPTAAIKGTSKPPSKEDIKKNGEDSNATTLGKVAADDVYVPVTIPAPLTLTDTTDPNSGDRAAIPRSRSDRGRDGIAMVSPIMSNASSTKLDAQSVCSEPLSNKGNGDKEAAVKSETSSSMHDSGVSGTNMATSASTNSSLSDSGPREVSEDADEVMLNIKPMLPILRASPYGYTRSLGPLHSSTNGRPLSSRIHGSSSGFSSSSSPSQQRLASLSRHGLQSNQESSSRLFGAGVSSLKRILDADYGVEGDIIGSNADIHASGYLSDGDILRITSNSSVMYGSCSPGSGRSQQQQEELYSCGYMSEGGASLYGRRVIVGGNGSRSSTQNAKGGPGSPSRNAKTINVLQDDSQHLGLPRLDDSSSISSGISDTINEFSTDDNLTGSSLSSEPNNPYGSLKRGPREGLSSKSLSLSDHHHRHHESNHSESSSRSSRKQNAETNHGSPASSGGRISKSCVKKTDSSMQTESSAFHHSNATSSAAWKKYMQQQQQQQQQQAAAQEAINAQNGHGHQVSGKKKGSSSSSSSSSGSKTKSMAVVNGVTEAFKGKSSKLTLSKDDLKQRPPVEGSGGSVRGSCESLQTTGKSSSSDKKGRSYSVSGTASPAAQGLVAYGQIKRSSGSVSNGSVIMCSSNGPTKSNGVSKSGSSKNRSATLDKGDIMPSVTQNHVAGKNTLERKGKVKVCANTQTTNHDLYVTGATALSDSEYSSLSRRHPGSGSSGTKHQYLLTSPTLGGLRERSYGARSSSLTNGTQNSADYVTLAGLHSLNAARDGRGPRLSVPGSGRLPGGSESDNYVSLDLSSNYGSANSPYAWIRPGGSISSAASVASAPAGRYCGGVMTGGLTEADSMESLASAGSVGVHSQGAQRYMFPLSPVNPMSAATPSGTSSLSYGSSRSSAAMSHYIGGLLSRIGNKEEDVHGSSLSLVSTSSSLYSTAEEKQAHEIRKLRRELEQAHEKVATLTSQLTTNAHMVAAFEQSLSNMTSRLQHLTASAEQKDSELMELRTTIEALKKQSAEAGLTKAALQSMQAVQRTLQEHRISRQLSTDSVSSVNSMSSACSTASKSGDDSSKKSKKSKKGWLRSSFSKAFSRSKKNRHGSVSDVEDPKQFQSDSSTPNSPLLGNYLNGQVNQFNNKITDTNRMADVHFDYLRNGKERRDSESSGTESKDDQTEDLKKQLREKDMVLTDIRLEALTSAHQLEGLRETLNKLRNEMAGLKQDNDRLQRLVSSKSLASSQSSLPLRNSVESLDKRLSVSEQSEHQSVDVYLNDAANDRDGKRVVISVFQGSHGDFDKFKTVANNRVLIGSVIVSGKTKWDLLDNVVKRTFKEYVLRVDPVSNLGLNAESVFSYHIGDIVRSKESELPELLPCGYFVGESSDIQVVIKGTKQNSVDALAFETLIPKSIVQRYMSLLTEHRRIILCGPSGTGKTYLAQKLAEFLVLKNGKDLVPGTVATFSVDHKSAKELRQYLSNVAEQCESSDAADLPTVIILDNLHHVGSLGEVFNGFLSAKYHKCPFIIGTMNQATCSTTNLQLHHNFRWVLCANHMEPVKGFLGRFLRRKLLDEEIRNGSRNPELTKIVDWMPKVWQQLNKFLETHSSSDVTIGPRLFLSCPLDVNSSQVWFTDLWNYSIVPYLLEAVREGLQLYGRRAPWEDPAGWVIETYPWACSPGSRDWPQLLRLRPEDVGYEGHPGPGGMGATKNLHSGGSDVETDPLLNMLMRLQEAATYSSPHSNDSDSTSQDGHSSCGGSGVLHADDVLNAGIESTL